MLKNKFLYILIFLAFKSTVVFGKTDTTDESVFTEESVVSSDEGQEGDETSGESAKSIPTKKPKIAKVDEADVDSKSEQVPIGKHSPAGKFESSSDSKSVLDQDAADLVAKLKIANFNCDFEESFKIVLCNGKISNYSQIVRIYIPKNYSKKELPKINLHFHGHRLDGYDTFDTANYGTRLVESGSTNILVIPESRGACANYDTELKGAGNMKAFISSLEMKTDLHNATYRLSSHSGGGRILSETLFNKSLEGRVEVVGLYDSIYQDLKGVREYLKSSNKNSVEITYVKGGTTINAMNSFLKTVSGQLSQIINNPVSPTKDSNPLSTDNHMDIMNNQSFLNFLSGK